MSVSNRKRHSGPGRPPARSGFGLFGWLAAVSLFGFVATAALAGALMWFLDDAGRTPREWVPYLARHAPGHRPSMIDAGGALSIWLMRADRLAVPTPVKLPARFGAAVERSDSVGRIRLVGSLPELQDAMEKAEPGDVLQLIPGTYRARDHAITARIAGTETAPITIRAARLGEVIIESKTVETFRLAAPWWRIENLVMRGMCKDDSECEHAVHVVGPALHIVIRNNRLEDYNAQIKINGEDGRFPDHGTITGNTLTDTRPRMTRNPITPIDLVTASNWQIEQNVIADFARGIPGNPTYGAFTKGEGANNVMERNIVLCEWKLRGQGDQRVGLSLGGGGTDMPLRREQGRTGFEQTDGLIRDNLIAFCSDVGVYVNRSARSLIDHNTLLDTAGIDVRYPESSARITANIVDGTVRSRDAGLMRGHSNRYATLLGLFIGYHPQRVLFRDPAELDLRWQNEPEAVEDDATAGIDLCGTTRPIEAGALPGAFQNFAACGG